MAIKLGIVMDPITTVNTKKDSTYAMMLAADAKGWEIYYMEQKDLSLVQGEAYGSMQRIHLKQDPENWYALDNSVDSPLTQLDVLLMRKDPPVDSEFIYATYIAAVSYTHLRAHETKANLVCRLLLEKKKI